MVRKKPSRAEPLEPAPTAPVDPALARIYEVVRAIPRGRIATYGQIAALAGIPRGHRVAARAMRTCPAGLPWQRVLGKKDARRAQVNIQDGEHAMFQRQLLEREGVLFDDEGRTQLARFGWLPSDPPDASTQRTGTSKRRSKRALKK